MKKLSLCLSCPWTPKDLLVNPASFQTGIGKIPRDTLKTPPEETKYSIAFLSAFLKTIYKDYDEFPSMSLDSCYRLSNGYV